MNVVNNQTFIDTRSGERNDIGDRHCAGSHLPTELGLDECPISSLGFVHSGANGGTAEDTHSGANGRPGACVSQGMTHDRSRSSAQQSAK